jgi:pyruvate-formate lyase
MSSWRDVLVQVRRARRRPAPRDHRKYWRALAYRRHIGEPEAVVRAQAFRSVLERVPLHFYEGETICGSRLGFCGEAPPPGTGEADFRAAVAEHDSRGQRDFLAGFDHSLADYPDLLTVGIDGLLERARLSRQEHRETREAAFLDAATICLEALAGFIRRHAEEADRRGDRAMADCLRAVAGPPPRSLREAVQLVWLTHLAFVSEGRFAMALGRIDRYLLPFYDRDIRAGRITREDALDLLCHLWAHVAELGEVTNICIGGLTPDGRDATNELSYLCLEATRLVQSPHTNLSARFHDATPERFHRACFEVIRTGVGFPAIFNDAVLVEGLTETGVPPEAARDHCMVGCIETMLAGRQQAWSDSRFNLALVLLAALSRLRDAGERSFQMLLSAFREILAARIAAHAAGIDAHIARFPPDRFPDPFLSALTRDCIGRARDINAGGAEYARFHGIAVMGLATVADSLAAVGKLVFEERRIPGEKLLAALDADFAGHEPLRQLLVNRAPKYGNDDPVVDALARDLVSWSADECLRHRTADGGRFVGLMAANIDNISAGRETPATPDGRRAGKPLSDAASPFFGRDTKGPTAFLHSVAAPDYRRAFGGNVINMKFEPEFFRSEAGARRFAALTGFFVKHRIPELQFNFTGDATLLAARRDPEKHRDLVVRVSGFSAYFVGLSPEVQEDIVRRRAHG